MLDIGARDRRLATQLDLQKINYFTADVDTGYDYQIDLENGLSLPDCAFDYVVALDVLEHVEHIHTGFHELARITRKKLIIALPNMSTLFRRWLYLRYGHLGTKKFDLYPEHQGDRHRWLTVYPQINCFIADKAERTGFVIDSVIEEIEVGFYGKIGAIAAILVSWLIMLKLLPRSLFTGRCIYILVRRSTNC